MNILVIKGQTRAIYRMCRIIF